MLNEPGIKKAKLFCCEDISLIENYDKAMNDDNEETIWICHHRLGIELNKSGEELEAMGLYWNRPASELLFLTTNEHTRLHNEKRWESQEKRDKLSEKLKKVYESQEIRDKISKALSVPKRKFKWRTPNGEIKEMDMNHAKRWHKDWTLIGPVL